MFILAIDTSCDDTSVALSKNDCLLVNVVSSQVELHKKWGGVVPSIAKQVHEEIIDDVLKEALKRVRIKLEQIDVFAVTIGPGLAIALEVGVRKIKELAKTYHKPVIAIDHMEGHLLANYAKNSNHTYYSQLSQFSQLFLFPFLALLISGGHTELILVNKIGDYQKIGSTLDDALGEAYDKVAKMLNLGYPGGPIIEKLAKLGNRQAYNLPIPMEKVPGLDFSYSGLKTSVLYLIKNELQALSAVSFSRKRESNVKQTSRSSIKLGMTEYNHLSRQQIIDIAASFERVAILHLVQRTERAIKKYRPKALFIGGGVTSNQYTRTNLRRLAKKYQIPFIWPQNKRLCADNAGMIAIAAFYKANRKEFVKDIDSLDRQPILSL